MPTWIKRWFQSPVFEDEDKTRVAGVLNVTLWVLIVVWIARIVTGVITDPKNASVAIGINGAMLGLTSGMLYLIRTDYVRNRIGMLGK